MPACSAPACSSRTEKGIRLFRFPSTGNRRNTWVEICQRAMWVPNENSRLCEFHFDANQFERSRSDGRRKLKPNAVPSVFVINSKYARKKQWYDAAELPAEEDTSVLGDGVEERTMKHEIKTEVDGAENSKSIALYAVTKTEPFSEEYVSDQEQKPTLQCWTNEQRPSVQEYVKTEYRDTVTGYQMNENRLDGARLESIETEITRENERLQSENEELRKRLEDTQNELAELTFKYSSLLANLRDVPFLPGTVPEFLYGGNKNQARQSRTRHNSKSNDFI